MGKRASVLALLLIAAAAAAGGGELPAPLREAQPELQPVGAATLHWFGLHVYDVALFAQEASFTTNRAAALGIHYNISIKRARLLDTTLKEWRRMGKGDDARRAQWIRQLESLWPDLKSGDRLTAFARPGGPTQFYFGDRLLGEVQDPEFGPNFLAIWLDADCLHPKVRQGLLGLDGRQQKGR